MGFLEDLNRDLFNNCAGLEKENKKLNEENKKLHEENAQLKKSIEKMRNHLQELHGKINGSNKMGKYADGIRCGDFKPRRNNDIDEEAVLKAILKRKTTDMKKVATELNTSPATIRRRLIEYNLYKIDLQGIRDYYIMFYSANNV